MFLTHLVAGLIYSHGFIYGSGNPINSVNWSLEIEAQFYVIIPLIMWPVFKRRNWTTCILMI